MEARAANSSNQPPLEQQQQQSTERNLEHMTLDENLYDFMKSLIPFNLCSANNAINEHVLNSGHGLEKGQFLNIYFNDVIGKRELTYELILSAILPKEWSLEDDQCAATDGQTVTNPSTTSHAGQS